MKLLDVEADRLLAAHGIRTARGAHRRENGTPVILVGATEDGRKTLSLSAGASTLSAIVPLGEPAAESLAEHVRGHHHVPDPKTRAMLRHLFERISALYETQNVRSFRMVIRLRENSYVVVDPEIVADGPVEFGGRPDARAHGGRGLGVHPAPIPLARRYPL